MAPRTFANLDATLGDWMALRTLPNLDATEELAWKLKYINIEMRITTDLETLMHPDFRNLPQHIQCRLKEMLQKALTSLTARTELPPDSPVPTEIPPDSPLPNPPIDSLAKTSSPTNIPVPPTPPKDPSAEGAEAQLNGAQPSDWLRTQYMQRKANKLATKARLATRQKRPTAPAASTATIRKKQKRPTK